MAKQTGLGDHLLVDGYDLSGDIGSVGRIAGGPGALVVTGIDKSAFERLGGLRDGGIDFTAYFNPSAGQAHPRLSSLPRTDVLVTYAKGYGIGNAAASCIAKQIGYDGSRGNDGSFTMNVATQSNAYGLEWGQQISAGLRSDTTATSPATGLDGTASSAFGAQFYLHLTTFTGTSVTIKIQDSADNSTFADLSGATFGALTAVGSARIAVTGTVRRYLKVVTTGTFSAATFLVNGNRNATATVF
jgi:hypothetical protein